jgi:hypothetical protein
MKRKYIVIAIAVLVIIAAIAGYIITRPVSPSSKTRISHNGLEVTVSYSRPYKKGRVIFDEESKGALVPYNQYWRLGASDATEISFNRDVSFAGKSVKAGTYRMYAVPGLTEWQVILNSELNKSGAEIPNHTMDVLTVAVPSAAAPTTSEQFTIELEEDGPGAKMNFVWDQTKVSVPIN